MNKIPLTVLGISCSQMQAGTYALILGEITGNRRIPIIIGGFEAQAIAIQLEGLRPPRPLTHDLFHTFALEYGISVEAVSIFRLAEGVFYSKLICTNGGKRVEIDARTSDAIALALRFHCPVYTTGEIMERAGIVFDNEPQSATCQYPPVRESVSLQMIDIPELEKLMNDAIMNENYELASEIRDELNRRKGG